VQELHFERALERGRVGNIYIGKVARVLPGMQSAFIDIGLERAAFLHIADVFVGNGTPRNDHSPGGAPPPPIERLIFEGQTLTVQVIKDPIGTKGARLSTQISIAGRLSSTCRRTSTSASRRRSARRSCASSCARA
jgi:ribonuclease G